MPGLVPGIHVLAALQQVRRMDGWDKPGHDVEREPFRLAEICDASADDFALPL